MKITADKLGVYIQLITLGVLLVPAIIAVYIMWNRVNEIYLNDQMRAIRAVERSMCKAIATEAAPAILELSYNKYREVSGYDYNLRSMDMPTKCAILGVDCVPCNTNEQ